MRTIIQENRSPFWRTFGGVISLVLFAALSGETSGQSIPSLHNAANEPVAQKAVSAASGPITSIYKELKIGASADEVRRLLGEAQIDDKDGFFYDLDSEVVQIRLDPQGTVRLIAVTYADGSPNAPKYADIFGAEQPAIKPDGSIYELVRYPEAGYWIAYSKTAGDKPTVTVTMQKL